MSLASEKPAGDTTWALRLGGPLLTTALGIALQVSDVDGVVVEAAAWVAVAGGAFLLVTGSFTTLDRCAARRRGRLRRRREGQPYGFAGQLFAIGHRILRFKHARDVRAPTFRPAPNWIRHPLRASKARQAHVAALEAHEQDTLAFYDQRFGPEVRPLVRELMRRGHLGEEDAHLLLGPESAAMVEDVGLRLIEFGKLLSRPRQEAA